MPNNSPLCGLETGSNPRSATSGVKHIDTCLSSGLSYNHIHCMKISKSIPVVFHLPKEIAFFATNKGSVSYSFPISLNSFLGL